MKVRFKSFSSGSCGNCYFLGIEEEGRVVSGVLIDAGVSLRRLKNELQSDGLSTDCFGAILITHDHFDHIRSLGSYCKHLQKPVWTTQTLQTALSHHVMSRDYLPSCKRVMDEGVWTEVAPRITARWFEVPHDATQTVGFAIMLGDEWRYVHITDCGRMTREALDFCRQADTVVLESNYDTAMLRGGSYPKELQDRIAGGHGHISNDECAGAIRSFVHDGLREVFLCHLSENNNTPELAYACSRPAVPETCRLQALPRQTATPLLTL